MFNRHRETSNGHKRFSSHRRDMFGKGLLHISIKCKIISHRRPVEGFIGIENPPNDIEGFFAIEDRPPCHKRPIQSSLVRGNLLKVFSLRRPAKYFPATEVLLKVFYPWMFKKISPVGELYKVFQP